MGKKQKNNSAYNCAPTDKKETVYKNDTNDEYVYENGQYESCLLYTSDAADEL